MTVSLLHPARSRRVRATIVSWALTLWVCLGASLLGVAGAGPPSPVDRTGIPELEIGETAHPQHCKTCKGVCDASNEVEEEESEIHFASGCPSSTQGDPSAPDVALKLEESDGVGPNVIRFCLDARGPPAA